MVDLKENVGYTMTPFFTYQKGRAITIPENAKSGSELRLQMSYNEAKSSPRAVFYFEKKSGDDYYIRTKDGLYLDSEHGGDIVDSFIVHLHRSKKIILSDKSKRSVFHLVQRPLYGRQEFHMFTFGDAVSTKGSDTDDVNFVRSKNYHEDDIKDDHHNFYFEIVPSLYKPMDHIPEIENKDLMIKLSNANITLDSNLKLFGTEKEQKTYFNNYKFQIIYKTDYFQIKTNNKFLMYKLYAYSFADSNYDPASGSTTHSDHHTITSDFILSDNDQGHFNVSRKNQGDVYHVEEDKLDLLTSKFRIKKVDNSYKIYVYQHDLEVGIASDLPKEQDLLGIVNLKGFVDPNTPDFHKFEIRNVLPVLWDIKPAAEKFENTVYHFSKENTILLVITILTIIIILGLVFKITIQTVITK